MDAFEKWADANHFAVDPDPSRALARKSFHAGKAVGIKEGMRRAAAMAGTMAERPFDSEPEFSAVLAVEAAILKEAGE